MRGRRCSLCGGRLDNNHICRECGLDNTKSDANYSMRHVSSAEAKWRMQQAKRSFEHHGPETGQNMGTDQYRGARKLRGRIGFARLMMFVLVFGILGGLIPGIVSLFGTVSDSFSGSGETDYSYDTDYEYDPYKYLTKEFHDGGEAYSTTLGPGEYIVGVHIPEGKYAVKGNEEDSGSIYVRDEANSLYFNYFMSGENDYREEDVRLFLGARVTLDIELEFISENAQTSLMTSQENVLTESVLLDVETATAGEAFEPGVYDLVLTREFGSIEINVPDNEGGSLDNIYVWLDAEDDRNSIYKNVVLPEGAQISCMDSGMQLMLVPSDRILNTDYISCYTGECLEQEPFAELLDEKELEGE